MAEELLVKYGDRLVGLLTARRSGQMAFAYTPSWLEADDAFPISVSLPLVSDFEVGLAEHAFFANLLPEGSVREAVARRLGISESNDFTLLKALGGECAGALTILSADAAATPDAGDYERLPPEAIVRMARRHSVLPEVIGDRGVRLSLAGAQDKLPVKVDDDGSLWLPIGGAPSTHILKVPSRDFKHLPANEVLITRLARESGLEVVDIDLLRFDDVELAVVRRYDRVVRDDRIVRLHQEDLCQALGLPPGAKYEQEGGPRVDQAMEVVRDTSVEPLVDAAQLSRWLVFVLLAGNADGHGKNLSLLYPRPGRARLAPFYDLVCTRIYERIDRSLAMSVGGQRDPGQINRRCWERLARELGIGKRLLLGEVETLATAMPRALDEVAARHVTEHGESPAAERIRRSLRKQCRRSLDLLV